METKFIPKFEPRVSVIVPVFNGSGTIERAIKSIQNQTFGDFEILVIDDCSTDQTAEIVQRLNGQDPRIILIRNPENLGLQKSLNIAIKKARAELIARLDDDDYWTDPKKLEQQFAFLAENPEYAVVGTNYSVIGPDGKSFGRYKMPETDSAIRKQMLFRNPILHISILSRKELIERVGGYNESRDCLYAEDYELWLKLGKIGKLYNLQIDSVTFTFRPSSTTSKSKLIQCQNFAKLIRRYKRDYPGFWLASLKAQTRTLLYGRLGILNLKHALNRFLNNN